MRQGVSKTSLIHFWGVWHALIWCIWANDDGTIRQFRTNGKTLFKVLSLGLVYEECYVMSMMRRFGIFDAKAWNGTLCTQSHDLDIENSRSLKTREGVTSSKFSEWKPRHDTYTCYEYMNGLEMLQIVVWSVGYRLLWMILKSWQKSEAQVMLNVNLMIYGHAEDTRTMR